MFPVNIAAARLFGGERTSVRKASQIECPVGQIRPVKTKCIYSSHRSTVRRDDAGLSPGVERPRFDRPLRFCSEARSCGRSFLQSYFFSVALCPGSALAGTQMRFSKGIRPHHFLRNAQSN